MIPDNLVRTDITNYLFVWYCIEDYYLEHPLHSYYPEHEVLEVTDKYLKWSKHPEDYPILQLFEINTSSGGVMKQLTPYQIEVLNQKAKNEI